MTIRTEPVEIPFEGGGAMGGYLAVPEGDGPHPAVLVFMEIFGINAHIRDVTERVAQALARAKAARAGHAKSKPRKRGKDTAAAQGGGGAAAVNG